MFRRDDTQCRSLWTQMLRTLVLAMCFASAVANRAEAIIIDQTITHPDGTREHISFEITASQTLAVGACILVKLLFDPAGDQFSDIVPPPGWSATMNPKELPFTDPNLSAGNFVAVCSPGPVNTPQKVGDMHYRSCQQSSALKMQYRRADTGAVLEEGPFSAFGPHTDAAVTSCATPPGKPALPGWAGIALAGLLFVAGIFVFGKRRTETQKG